MVYLVLAVFGLCLGSFVNALVWRIRKQSLVAGGKVNREYINTSYSIINGRSMCVHCKNELAAKDLIPVLSWLSLGGKCRYCRKGVSWQYPIVEVLTSLIFVFSYWAWPSSGGLTGTIQLSIWLIILTGFVALVIYDLKWMELPNRIVYPLLGFALILSVINIITSVNPIEIISLTFFSILISGGLFYIIFQLSSGRWIGGGDVKLGLLIGLILQDPYKAFLMLFFASLLGTVFIIPGMLLGKVTATSKIPFGPFLILSTILVFLLGDSIINWYLSLI